MAKAAYYGLVCLSMVFVAWAEVTLDSRHLCSMKDPQLRKCSVNAVQAVLAVIAKGVPKFGILPVDPLHVDLLSLSYTPSRTLDIKLKLMDVDMIGMSSAIIKDVRIGKNLTSLEIDDMLTKPFVIKGVYESVGRFLALPINGAGPFNITVYDLIGTLKFTVHKEEDKGKRRLRVEKVRFPIKISKLGMNFTNIFKGNAQISDAINDALNENWESVRDDMLPSFEEAIGEAFKEITNRAMAKLTVDNLIKDYDW